MYGIIPKPKIDARKKAPPANIFINPTIPPVSLELVAAFKASTLTPGRTTYDPKR